LARKVLIQIRRGAESIIGALAVGELGYCTDTQKLYIGTTSGNVLLVAAQSTGGDMLKSIYDTNNNGKVDAAEAADSVSWAGVTGKPATYTPSTHTHDASELTTGTLASARLPAATTGAQGAMSAADKAKLDGIAAGAQVNAVTSVAGRTGAVVLTADDVAETTANKVMTAAERTKLAGIAAGANNYVHPGGDGNQHIPATGTGNNGRVLKAGATAGSAAWGIVDWGEISGKPSTFTPAVHSHSASDITSGTLAADRLPAASTSASGVVQLNTATNSTSTTQAATASAVKAVYDLAAGKLGPGVTWNQLKGV
jgi:hypothetical protein